MMLEIRGTDMVGVQPEDIRSHGWRIYRKTHYTAWPGRQVCDWAVDEGVEEVIAYHRANDDFDRIEECNPGHIPQDFPHGYPPVNGLTWAPDR
jgi:hypothetical protein